MDGRIIITKNKKARFQCPKCGKTKTQTVSSYLKTESAVRVHFKCPCGRAGTFLLERRKTIRRDVHFNGVIVAGSESNRRKMLVTNLSRSGVQIEHNLKKPVRIGDKFYIGFHLDDPRQSFIQKEVVVRRIHKGIIGAEFLSKEHFDPLGPYLLHRLQTES